MKTLLNALNKVFGFVSALVRTVIIIISLTFALVFGVVVVAFMFAADSMCKVADSCVDENL